MEVQQKKDILVTSGNRQLYALAAFNAAGAPVIVQKAGRIIDRPCIQD
jgi:hypothetical protein